MFIIGKQDVDDDACAIKSEIELSRLHNKLFDISNDYYNENNGISSQYREA